MDDEKAAVARVVEEIREEIREVWPPRRRVEWGLARLLNSLPEWEHRLAELGQVHSDERAHLEAVCSVLRAAGAILVGLQGARAGHAIPAPSVRAFNLLARPARMRPLIVESRRGGARATTAMMEGVSGNDYADAAVILLWEVLRQREMTGRLGLKQCLACPSWFLDTTRPGNARKCRQCDWSRQTRRRAGHGRRRIVGLADRNTDS